LSNNRINNDKHLRGRFSDLVKEKEPRKKQNEKAFLAQQKRVLSYLKNSYPDESMTEYLKRMKSND